MVSQLWRCAKCGWEYSPALPVTYVGCPAVNHGGREMSMVLVGGEMPERKKARKPRKASASTVQGVESNIKVVTSGISTGKAKASKVEATPEFEQVLREMEKG